MVPSYPKTPHWPASLSVHRDDHYHLRPERFLNVPVVITEKLDGGICTISSGKAYARSSADPTYLSWFDYVKSRTVPRLYGAGPEICVIGEDLYAVHSIEYDPLPDSFFLFHVLERTPHNIDQMETDGDRFWDWPDVVNFAVEYQLRHVPVLFDGQFTQIDQITDWFMTNVKEPSLFGPTREGFVMRTQEGFLFDEFGDHVAKFVRKNHVQTTEHWTKHWKPARFAK